MTKRIDYNAMFMHLAPEGAAWCRGITPTGHYCTLNHDLEGSIDKDVVHFRDRRATDASETAFLKLVARVNDPSLDEDVPWRRVYRLNMAVRGYARELGIRNPARLAHGDRAFVLASVTGLPNTVPMRKQAFDWARRGPKRKEVNHA